MLRDLATWTIFPADTDEFLATGTDAEAGDRTLAELAVERDESRARVLPRLKAADKK